MIVSRPTKPSPLPDPTPKKRGGCHGLPCVLGSAPRKVYAEDMHWPIEGFPAENAQASVKGSHWLAPSLREEADVLWLDKSGI